MRVPVAIILLAVLLAYCNGARLAHSDEPDDPPYKHHPAEWSGAWIYEQFRQCCGKEDCYRANSDADRDGLPGLRAWRAEDGTGYFVTWPPHGDGATPTPEFIPYQEAKPSMDPDGEYWVCHTGGQVRSTRCLFIPPLGF